MGALRDWLFWQRLQRSTAPILVGPWRTELGFEALYWLPWLAQKREQYHLAKDRLIAVSRGGAGIWYDAGQSVELYDHAPVAQLRHALLTDAHTSGSIKHQRIADWETALLAYLATSQGLTRYHVLHPSRMYQDLMPWFDGQMPSRDVLARLRFGPVPVPVMPPLDLPLPERFLAVGFYARHTWPLNDELKAFVLNQIDHLTKHVPVVLLESGFHADDHIAFPIPDGPHILRLGPYLTPRNNFAVQSAVLAKAIGFVGTYGGLMQLAVRLGKPAVGFYSTFEGTCYAHKQLTEWLAVQQRTPCFIGRPEDARFIREILP